MSSLNDKSQCHINILNWVRTARYDLKWPAESIISQMGFVMAGFKGIELNDHSCILLEIINHENKTE